MRSMAKLSEYLTVSEAAEYLGVSADSLRRWDRSGKLAARRHPVSGYRLYLKVELDAFLKTLKAWPKSRKNRKA
jgi:excisionase family DNA binding protein